MFVIQCGASFSAGSGSNFYLVRVVKADEPLTLGSMKRQRVAETVRSCLGRRHAPHNELDPISCLGIKDEQLAIQIEQGVQ